MLVRFILRRMNCFVLFRDVEPLSVAASCERSAKCGELLD